MRTIRKGFAGALGINDTTGLMISRPDLQEGLTKVIEAGVAPVAYINQYHAEFEVDCAFCAKHTPHLHGYTVEMEDGRIALCGEICAGHFFGSERALELSRGLGQRMQRASLRQAVANAQTRAPAVLEALTEELLNFEKAALEAVCRIARETSHLSLRHQPIPGIDALKFASVSTALRLADARRRLEMIMAVGLDEADDVALSAKIADFGSIESQLEVGLRFVTYAAALFSRENFWQVNDFCRAQHGAIDKFSLVTELSGALSVHQFPRGGGKPSRVYLGKVPDIPSFDKIRTAIQGVDDGADR